jgi:prepilin-type N-terminal cleavage/methylation domain-containing protein
MTTHRGLSLIEVVLAIIILGLAVPPLLFSISAGAKQQQSTMIEQNLVQLASERLWAISAQHADPTRGYAAITAATYPNETAPRAMTGYTRRTEIREVSPSDYTTSQPASGIKRFRVTVTGPGKQSLTVESFVTNVPGG